MRFNVKTTTILEQNNNTIRNTSYVPNTAVGIHGLYIAQGTIVKRAYGTHEYLYISLFLLLITMFGPINYGPP